MRQLGDRTLSVVVVVALIGFPVLAVILLIEGVWWPAAIVALGLVMSWWRGRHDGAYLPATIVRWHANHRR
jgi:hypothetical protein